MWAREDGIALVLSMIVMGVLTIATAATITAVTSNEHAFGRDRQTNRALNVAEAGLNAAVAKLKSSPASTTSLPPGSGNVDTGSYSYTTTRTQDATDPNLYYWTVTSTGTSPDTNVTRIISTKVSQKITPTSTSTTTPVSPSYAYGFFLGDPASDCATLGGGNSFSGNGEVRVDVYVRGSLCLQGNGAILQPTGTSNTLNLYVGRKFKYIGTAPTVGTSSAKIKTATIVGGCLRNNSAVTCSSSANSHVYATTYSSTQNDITKPTIDPAWYTNAKPGPTTGCNDDPTHPGDPAYQSSYPSGWTATDFKNAVLDNDSTRNTSISSVNLFRLVNYSSASNFDCRYYGSDGTLLGRIAWTYGNPGTFVIYGNVWIDGNLVDDGTNYAVYQGRGNIYVNGTVSFQGQALLCATPLSGYSNCVGKYDPHTNLLEIVAVNAGNASNAFSITGQQTFEGVCFMNGSYAEAGNGTLNGAVIADTATVSGNGSYPSQFDPPPGAPGAASTTTTSGPDQVSWNGVPGTWQQLK